MITPLRRHHGRHGPIIAMVGLVAVAAIIMFAHPRRAEAPPVAAPKLPAAAATLPDPVLPPPPPAVLDSKLVATGVVGYDEKVTAHVRVPVSGILVDVKRTGRTVRRGTRFANLYSADIVHAELELIAQVRNFTNQAALDHARNRLLNMGIAKETIHEVEVTGRTQGKVPVWAWLDGTVVANRIIPGLYVEPSVDLVTITDPTRMWVLAEVPEQEAARVAVGMEAKLVIEGQPKPVVAKVGYVYSRVYAGNRYVRFELVNPRGKIKPETPAKIELGFAGS